MIDLPRGDLVVARETREDWQTRRVGGSPGQRTLLVGHKIPHRGRASVPTGAVRIRAIQFVEPAIAVIEDQDVPVAAARRRVTLDRRAHGNWHWPRIALVSIGREVNGDRTLLRPDDQV